MAHTPRDGDIDFVGPSRSDWESYNRSNDYHSAVNVPSIFTVLFLVLLIVTVFRLLTRFENGVSGTFYIDLQSLFTKFSEAPTISTSWISSFSTNYGETFPYGFQWLGHFIDFICQMLSGIFFASVSVSNALIFLFYFLRWILL